MSSPERQPASIINEDDLMRREAADKDFAQFAALFRDDDESILSGTYFSHCSEIWKEEPAVKRQRCSSTIPNIACDEPKQTGISAANSSAITTASAQELAKQPVALKEITKKLCIALNSGDEDLMENVFSEHSVPDLTVFNKWMGSEVLNRSVSMKSATCKSRSIFLAIWKSRHNHMPDAILKFHFPFSYHKRVDGGITVSANLMMIGTKLTESKVLLPGNKIDGSLLEISMEQTLTRPRDKELVTATKDVSVASCYCPSHTFDKGILSATKVDSVEKYASAFENNVYQLEKPVNVCCWGTFSFHFDKTTEKVFELDMLWNNYSS